MKQSAFVKAKLKRQRQDIEAVQRFLINVGRWPLRRRLKFAWRVLDQSRALHWRKHARKND